jgi:hypothetical protein
MAKFFQTKSLFSSPAGVNFFSFVILLPEMREFKSVEKLIKKIVPVSNEKTARLESFLKNVLEQQKDNLKYKKMMNIFAFRFDVQDIGGAKSMNDIFDCRDVIVGFSTRFAPEQIEADNQESIITPKLASFFHHDTIVRIEEIFSFEEDKRIEALIPRKVAQKKESGLEMTDIATESGEVDLLEVDKAARTLAY